LNLGREGEEVAIVDTLQYRLHIEVSTCQPVSVASLTQFLFHRGSGKKNGTPASAPLLILVHVLSLPQCKKYPFRPRDNVVEWLTRSPAITSTADSFGSAGSNPVVVAFCLPGQINLLQTPTCHCSSCTSGEPYSSASNPCVHAKRLINFKAITHPRCH
jgi:hypothetical protein